jgi:hypothetical protein
VVVHIVKLNLHLKPELDFQSVLPIRTPIFFAKGFSQ